MKIASLDKLHRKVDEAGNPAWGHTMPLPVFDDGRCAFLVMMYQTTLMDVAIRPPHWMRVFHAESLELLRDEAFDRASWHIPDPKPPLRKVIGLKEKREPAFHELLHQFAAANELLWPAYFAQVPAVHSWSEVEAARLLYDRWAEATEPGLLAHYRTVGSEWFAWLAKQKTLLV